MSTKQLLCIDLGGNGFLREAGARGLDAAWHGWQVHPVKTLAAAARALRSQAFTVGLLMSSLDGLDDIDCFLQQHWATHWIAVFPPRILQSAACRRLVRDHCYDYHTLPLDMVRLRHTLGHAHGWAALRELAEPGPDAAQADMGLKGQGAAVERLRRQIRKVAGASAPVLIWGESGSGKELAAQAIHAHSPRAAGPFVPINCGAIPAGLAQSELFGHERGAFTGAARDKRGLIESAAGGTVFLDEIGDLPLALQTNLLRFLQEKTIHRVGAAHSITVDARVIAASHVNLLHAVQQGNFREDLYYRLNVLALDVPPLRERKEDLLLLANHFFSTYLTERSPLVKGFSSAAAQAMLDHGWPGNVRELINRVRRAMVMAEGRLIVPQDLGLAAGGQGEGGQPALGGMRLRADRDAVQASLLRSGRNISQAARELGVSRMTLYRLIKKLNIKC
ncbi:sigma-54 dependent transcriptional regulator [Janthinobacterium psychrotolerans]|uniref:DNA-binding transcriptional response regulator, NtrC family n=1 Tax=Janthinobacterium psychrotolerans TaxID=1747903 RepID=A0A1A7C062_9BURK|nr:sigma-54 dependent transcriptional regulator [Janthinobacterium psychrotolerans]OBV38389.1 DNA-binding transcriptional response regulator, NtrC family [Janthinobacterium psychrotolerans]